MREEAGDAVLDARSGDIDAAVALVSSSSKAKSAASSTITVHQAKKKLKIHPSVAELFKGADVQKQVDVLLQKWVVDQALPFTAMDSPYFVAALKLTSGSGTAIRPPSAW